MASSTCRQTVRNLEKKNKKTRLFFASKQGRRKHFFGGQAKNIMETNGALARREFFDFNYIHDYDVIIIGHERSSKVAGMLSLPTSG